MSEAATHALVALHGFTGGSASFAGLRAELADAPVAIDALPLLGHGARGDAAEFVQEVDRLAREIASRSEGPALLLGYSLGGRVAMGLLARHPERFAGALLVGAHPGLESSRARRERVAADGRWVRLLREEGLDAFVAAWESLPLFASQVALPEATRAAQDAVRRSHDPEGLARSLEVLGLGVMPDWRAGLARFPGELTLAVGEADAKFRGVLEPLAAARGHRLRVVPGAGHNVLLERPAEIARLVEELRREVESK